MLAIYTQCVFFSLAVVFVVQCEFLWAYFILSAHHRQPHYTDNSERTAVLPEWISGGHPLISNVDIG